ncbi:L-type lectin-domain containing receptor kinase IX.1 [Hibiscus syriacus]|uniref:L-type lectin-domain containing receptor kinase IX.1 n=1 Tax=Hibiscus syriacus TaxID=106335 RepID=A0A6A3BXF8_HIBSY|nr:L-type lectin-domain containing receptor kinase IX.1 [Hibiscus syriacus]
MHLRILKVEICFIHAALSLSLYFSSMASGIINSLKLCILIPFLSALPFANSMNFQISRFDSNTNNISYQGDARPAVGTIEFNLIDYLYRVGWETYVDKVPLWDSRTRRLADFNTRFSFSISMFDPTYGHGLAFFLAPVGSQIPPNSGGGFLGLFNTTTSDSPWNQIVHVEFDTYENNETRWDPPGVAATGKYVEQNTLQSWEFNSSLTVEEKARAGGVRNVGIVIGVVVPVGVLMIFGTIVVFIIWWRKKHVTKSTPVTTNLTSMNDDLERGAGPRRFSFTDLSSATDNFSEHRKLGEGGFGSVYRGYLNDLDMPVVVKRISSGSRQGEKEYVTEVKVISQLRHKNLVQLIGWCHDRNNFILVYEFMPNCSLDSHLFGRRSPLTWPVRYRISLGLASALLYLHEEWEQCVVHRDVKSSNVMLGSSFNFKLGDFGLAKLMDHEISPKTTGLAGTFGYLAPEYISTVDGKLDKDFDEKQVLCLMIVGLWCAHPDCNSRPSMRRAIQVLYLESPLPNLPVKMPVPMYHVSLPSVTSGSEEPSVTYSSMNVGR